MALTVAGLFVPQQFGYVKANSPSKSMDVSVDVRALATAMAVNSGILNISNLEMLPRDEVFASILKQLVKANFMTKAEANLVKPFYDVRFEPRQTVYCMVVKDGKVSNYE